MKGVDDEHLQSLRCERLALIVEMHRLRDLLEDGSARVMELDAMLGLQGQLYPLDAMVLSALPAADAPGVTPSDLSRRMPHAPLHGLRRAIGRLHDFGLVAEVGRVERRGQPWARTVDGDRLVGVVR